jgi:hypothetical protein
MRASVRFVAMVVCGFAYGFATSYIPSPHDVGVFWISNLAAPWLLLAFIAGAVQRRAGWAVGTAIITGLALVAGFYRLPSAFNPRWYEIGVDRDTPHGELVRTSLRHWLDVNTHWLVIAVIAGVVFGLLGHLWAHRGWPWTGAAMGLAIAAEPLYWRFVADDYWPRPVWIWPVEAVVGVLLAVQLKRRRVATDTLLR